MILGIRRKRAVAYYRHSAEDKQENSVPIQQEHTQKFAQENRIEIIHEEKDEGKTGLNANRPGFKSLFENWILNEDAPHFDYVLVYDVSRWGRFQDLDEAASLIFRCKQRGKRVIYVTQGMIKENSPTIVPHLQTVLEQIMAAEYSRQLSDKVFWGCVKVSKQGYSAGGSACYGMDRMLLDEQRNYKGILRPGEHKAIDNQRVTFIPSNNQKTATVRKIFDLFVDHRQPMQTIAQILNQDGIPAPAGGKWNQFKIIRILRNETYMGTRIYNKTNNRLMRGKKSNPRSEWIINSNAFPPIVDQEKFSNAQQRLQQRQHSTHLYGNRILKQAKRTVRDYFVEVWSAHSPEDLMLIFQRLPLTFSITKQHEANLKWYFTSPRLLQAQNYCIGVGVNQKDSGVERIFKLPVTYFGTEELVIISSHDQQYKEFNIEDSDAIKELFLIAAERIL